MSEFLIYSQIGLTHILNLNSYDHILFLVALATPYTFKEWKRILILVSLFTIGHTLALFLSVFNILVIQSSLVELLIPFTILITAVSNFFMAGKPNKDTNISVVFFITLFFGIIHGLGFSNYFKSILGGTAVSKLLPLCEFALGVEAAQTGVVLVVLLLGYGIQTIFRLSKREWILTISSFIVGTVLPIIIKNKI